MNVAVEFSTLLVPPNKRVARWTEAAFDRFVESAFEVLDEDGFIATMRNRELAQLSLTRIDSAGHSRKRVTRSQHQVARAAEDFVLVSIQLEGGCRVVQGNREAILAPGQFAIYDSTRPYELILEEDYQQAVLRVPRAALLSRLGDADLTALAVAAEALPARMLNQMVRCACDSNAPLSSAQSLDVADGVMSVLTSGLRGLQGEPDVTSGAGARQIARVKSHVAENLGDPQLTVGRIALFLGLSVSYLHKIFRSEGTTLERWIWEMRLAACQRALRDPRWSARTISDIAFSFGFSDAAHFSRSFHRRFAITPRAWRQADDAPGSSRPSVSDDAR
ncbi:helix-turn-helix domain-containing protein [Ideonella azotifigens]|uniref:Helix-turn-helix domain-containing protein n=1 Tax=Ideonella azotifigens TaxID=513160 RepID=A0ABP3VRI3_9BURK|nr:helix-turn-helix domain-containing protein [Ideonella azotifigens]MCD2340459.1 helix-turn-helix domain-containing protein [Ideonella azotifigens]